MPLPNNWLPGFGTDEFGRNPTIPAQVATPQSPDAARLSALAAAHYAAGDSAAGLGASVGSGVAQTFYSAAAPIRTLESTIAQAGRNVGHFAGGLFGAAPAAALPAQVATAPAAVAPAAAAPAVVTAPAGGLVPPARVPALATPGIPLPVAVTAPAAAAPTAPVQSEYEKMVDLPAGSIGQMWAHTPLGQRAGLITSLLTNRGALQQQQQKAQLVDQINSDFASTLAKVVPGESEVDRQARLADAREAYFKRLQANANPQGALAGLYTGANAAAP